MSFFDCSNSAIVVISALVAAFCVAEPHLSKWLVTGKVKGKKARTDQKCPSCGTWQSKCGGWAWVGNSDNPMIDFSAECGSCGEYSSWVWIGPGVCATYEEITKQQVGK